MRATRDSTLADRRRSNTDSQREVAELRQRLDEALHDRDEALAQQAATAEVLGVINASPGNLGPVFEAMLDKAMRLCEAAFGGLWTYDGGNFRSAAMSGVPEPFAEFNANNPPVFGPGSGPARLVEGEPFNHVVDLTASEAYLTGEPNRKALVDLGGARTALAVPLRKDDALVGLIMIYRQEVRPFSDKQIALLQNFAAQAVVAMENARLINETREALDQQTATAEVLGVINSSPGDLGPVFDALLERATRLCEASWGLMWMTTGERFQAIATRGMSTEFVEFLRDPDNQPRMVASDLPIGRVVRGEATVHVLDLAADEVTHQSPTLRKLQELGGFRTVLALPLRNEDALLGAFVIGRREVRPFTDKQIALLQNFAAQAVIAMENARLITETRDALNRQTATAEVLSVINASPGDLTPVFDTILEKAHTVCGATVGTLFLYDGEKVHAVATRGYPEDVAEVLRQGIAPPPPLLAGERLIHVPDVSQGGGGTVGQLISRRGGVRTNLIVPLRKDRVFRGMISCNRKEVRPYTDQEIALIESFAAQAVIAMENARLLGELRERTDDLQEALERQTGISDVLKVISQSTFDLQPVLDTLSETAGRLCQAELAFMTRREGDVYRFVTAIGSTASTKIDAVRLKETVLDRRAFVAGRQTITGRVLATGQVVQIEDIASDPEYTFNELVTVGKVRTLLGVPLMREAVVVGTLNLGRQRVEPFTEKQIDLVRTFADQAVIAMENARLITETREALEQQTATAEVLGVINSSPGDLVPVWDAMLDKAMHLCGAAFGHLMTYDGGSFQAAAVRGEPRSVERLQRLREHVPYRPASGITLKRIVEGERVVHIADITDTAAYRAGNPIARAMVDIGECRTLLTVALRKEDTLLGTISLYRQGTRPFSEKESALLQSFAAQAVIAMENARLLGDLRERTADLQQSLEYQTATSDVLKVISRSDADLETVLENLVATVTRLCQADHGHLFRRHDEYHHLIASSGLPAEYRDYLKAHPFVPDRGTLSGRVALERRIVQIEDAASDPEYARADFQQLGNLRTGLGVPLLRDETLLGIFALYRSHVERFTDKQIALAATFADQAVIAIENARLLGELRDRQAELRATFDNMADGVAMFDQELRLAAWNRNFQELLQLDDALLTERPMFDDYIRHLTERGEFGDTTPEAEIARLRSRLSDHYSFERTRPDGTVIEVRNNPMPDGGTVVIYSDITERKRSEAEIRAARDAAEAAYRDLKAAQANLVQAQKMAALGQLTAGIAHEIKNPLNFVNNFAGLSVELLDELKETAAPGFAALDEDKRADVDETMELLSGNLGKIAEHGQRADNIVRSMLEHSRGVSGDRREVDLNALIDEALNLAYHGARAQDQSFNITLERDYASTLKPLELAPQEITRVFLNLFGNGFYAASKRAREDGKGYRPVLSVATREEDDAVEVRVRDNGIGILPEVRDKLFQPFFTTKPTGEGTGLGLSISYDIVTQQHGGTITVESEPGAFTEFTVRLPRY